jgi:PAS domain S-box-containing protein
VPVGIAHVTADGNWVTVNQALRRFLSYSAAELTTMSFRDVTHPDGLAAQLSPFRAAS